MAKEKFKFKIRIDIILILVCIFSIRCAPLPYSSESSHGSGRTDKLLLIIGEDPGTIEQPSEQYLRLRQLNFNFRSNEPVFISSGEDPGIIKVFIEIATSDDIVGIAFRADGTASIYSATGSSFIRFGGMIDIQRLEEVGPLPMKLLIDTVNYFDIFAPIQSFPLQSYPLPAIGKVRFWVVTSSGLLTAEADREELLNGSHKLSSLYQQADAIFTLVKAYFQQELKPRQRGAMYVWEQNPNLDYLTLRKAYATVLKKQGHVPEPWPHNLEIPPIGVREVYYTSYTKKLKAWFALPTQKNSEKYPAVVYFSGGFGMTVGDFYDVEAFLKKGYALMLPTLRGQNGNPGNFEMLYGEVDDARAAIRWLLNQPDIDPARIYTFGHSAGGAISALLSFWDDVPLKISGSCSGIYDDSLFDGRPETPFDTNKPIERALRLLHGNERFIKKRHIAYVGKQDSDTLIPARGAYAEANKFGTPLEVIILEGDHYNLLPKAIERFIDMIQSSD
jgi:hypothetical protein